MNIPAIIRTSTWRTPELRESAAKLVEIIISEHSASRTSGAGVGEPRFPEMYPDDMPKFTAMAPSVDYARGLEDAAKAICERCRDGTCEKSVFRCRAHLIHALKEPK